MLKNLEALATKQGSVTVILAGVEFEVSRQVKSKYRRFSYRHGNRHMARDEALELIEEATP